MAATLLAGASSAVEPVGDWIYIAKSQDALTTFYKQRPAALTADHKRRVRLLYDYQRLQQDPDTLLEHRSTVVVVSVDCMSYKLATIQSTDYSENMGKGKASSKTAALPDAALRYVSVVRSSGSIDDMVLKSLCREG